ncbi:MAG: efflux RND transporter periplasmic adaptor subunit [Planctomycetaceae bacterium]|nr:efflux RND transporter periplasmic adaptor subunit [Planctomycetaceae bacterium]
MTPFAPHAGTADVWNALDHLVDELVERSRSSASPQRFYGDLLSRTVEALAAESASIWEVAGDGAALRWHHIAPEHCPGTEDKCFERQRSAVVWSLNRCEALEIPPHSHTTDGSSPANPSDALVLVQPFVVDEHPLGAIVVERRTAIMADARRGALQFLATVAEIAADYHRNRQRILYLRRAAETDDLETLLTALNAEIDVGATATAAANEGRRWCAADRVSVLIGDQQQIHVEAISGVEQVDRRAASVRKLERLSALVAAQRSPLRYPSTDTTPVAPQVAAALAEYLEEAEPRTLDIVLLERGDVESSPTVGVLVREHFGPAASDLPDGELSYARFETLRRHAGRALANALEVEGIPLQRYWRSLAKNRERTIRRWSRISIACLVSAMFVGITFLVPARLTVEASGTLQPRDRRDVYSPLDAVVEEILVRHGDVVASGTPLLRLRKPELDLDEARLLGELRTAERRFAALKANRISSLTTDPAERRRRQELAADEEQLKHLIAGLQEQLELLRRQQAELVVRAPIAGKLTTWDPEHLLTGRPVARGDKLLHVADETGAWTLDLNVPQRGYDEVARALRNSATAPTVEFLVATRPEDTHTGRLVCLADAAETVTDEGTRMGAVVDFERDDVAEGIRRSGTSVSARIDCGPSSLGTMLSRDFIYYLRTRWWF